MSWTKTNEDKHGSLITTAVERQNLLALLIDLEHFTMFIGKFLIAKLSSIDFVTGRSEQGDGTFLTGTV